jgi:uncharacterized protein (DUF2062 family)
MKNKAISANKVNIFLTSLYSKLFRINDTPQRVAFGFGLGVACGIIPGTGPIVSFFLASILRVNRAAALIGCLLTNTWLSFITFLFAIKLGSAILGVSWQQVIRDWEYFLKDFHWLNLFKLSILKIVFPVIVGYLLIAVCLGLLAYLITLLVIVKLKHKRRQLL